MTDSPDAFDRLDNEDKEIVSALHTMLLANWEEAAGLAWASYQAHGRGAVLIDFRAYEQPPELLPFAGYVRLQDIGPQGDDLRQLKGLIQSYKPEEEALFVLYTPLGDTVIDLIPALEGRPTPPQAADLGGQG